MTGKKERKLSSILAMDVVSYSSKMAEDDEGTLKLLEERRVIIEKHIKPFVIKGPWAPWAPWVRAFQSILLYMVSRMAS